MFSELLIILLINYPPILTNQFLFGGECELFRTGSSWQIIRENVPLHSNDTKKLFSFKLIKSDIDRLIKNDAKSFEFCARICFTFHSKFAYWTKETYHHLENEKLLSQKSCFCSNELLSTSDNETLVKSKNLFTILKTSYRSNSVISSDIKELIQNYKITNCSDKNFRIIFFLQFSTHRTQQMINLLKLIYSFQHLYLIHLDEKLGDDLWEFKFRLKKYSNIYFLPRRFNCLWGGMSILEMQFYSFNYIITHLNISWNFIINLSESDLPMKSLEYIQHFLCVNKKKNFLSSHQTKKNDLNEQIIKFYQTQAISFSIRENHEKEKVIHDHYRSFPFGFLLEGGSDWFILNKNFIEYLVENFQKEFSIVSKFYKFSLNSFMSSETFFHLVTYNTRYCENVIGNNLRFIYWNIDDQKEMNQKHCLKRNQYRSEVCGKSPKTFTWNSLTNFHNKQLTDQVIVNSLLKNHGYLLARKFDEEKSQQIINFVIFRLRKMKNRLQMKTFVQSNEKETDLLFYNIFLKIIRKRFNIINWKIDGKLRIKMEMNKNHFFYLTNMKLLKLFNLDHFQSYIFQFNLFSEIKERIFFPHIRRCQLISIIFLNLTYSQKNFKLNSQIFDLKNGWFKLRSFRFGYDYDYHSNSFKSKIPLSIINRYRVLTLVLWITSIQMKKENIPYRIRLKEENGELNQIIKEGQLIQLETNQTEIYSRSIILIDEIELMGNISGNIIRIIFEIWIDDNWLGLFFQYFYYFHQNTPKYYERNLFDVNYCQMRIDENSDWELRKKIENLNLISSFSNNCSWNYLKLNEINLEA
ncbi:hypothetical protein SNEBB_010666 [Seison nebaliae]|nr:hypothetical protein SNEBB_010666 [Seison nebaliae]